MPRAAGVTFIPVAVVSVAVEWAADRTARGAPVAHHDVMPLDAQWIEDSGGRKSCRRPNGNRIERTIYAHMVVVEKEALLKTSFQFQGDWPSSCA